MVRLRTYGRPGRFTLSSPLSACPFPFLQGIRMRYQGFGGLIVLIADVWAIINIFQSNSDTAKKVLWTVVVILLPVAGFILWLLLGPKSNRA
jgi:Phospholipase_D-nuclease N-terminal